jgi:hypothetical protein
MALSSHKKAVINQEMQAIEEKLGKYNVEQLGEIPIKKWDNADSGMSNGRMHRQRGPTDKNVHH